MKAVRYTTDNYDAYIQFLNDHPASGIWHYPAWLDFQLTTKRAADGFIFGIEDNATILLAGMVLIYRGKFGLHYAYIPAGLLYSSISPDVYRFFYRELSKIVKKYRGFYTEIDSITPFSTEYDAIIGNAKDHVFISDSSIPQYTNVIDLSLSEDDILKQMKPKGRYNIKLAAKKGVVIKEGDASDIDAYAAILSQTAKRDGFFVNPVSYYRQMIECLPEVKFLLAYHEDELLAGGIFTYTAQQGLYYYGASSNHKRNLMAPYLVQWHAIQIARAKGCRYFDFMGIASPDKENHRLKGVTDFKLKFGGSILKFNTPYRIIHNKPVYHAYHLLKKLRG